MVSWVPIRNFYFFNSQKCLKVPSHGKNTRSKDNGTDIHNDSIAHVRSNSFYTVSALLPWHIVPRLVLMRQCFGSYPDSWFT